MHNSTDFRIGNYRPIYLWAGPGTIRMNKLKFMQVDVDENVHLEAHQLTGADLVVNGLFQNWIHLTFSWGFPPEIEQEDWQSFEDATNEYHKQGAKVFAYIQSSNCVYSGSFKDKDWYAITPKGKKVYYYTGRYMTCFQNNEWINYLKERIQDAIKRGADGIFFDNLWYGLQPNALFNTWLGAAGCYCTVCQEKYHQKSGKRMPTLIDLQKKEVLDYIEWRSQSMTRVIQQLSDFARSLKSDVIISANDYDPVMRPVKLIFGIDFQPLARIQDVTMIENFALPKWEDSHPTILVNNTLTVRNTQPYLPHQKHLSVLSYDAGIGFDPVYPTRRILIGMAEAAALGCSMTTKGTEYHDGEKMTLLTAPEYEEQQIAVGNLHHWLQDHQAIYQSQTKRAASVGILHPGDQLWQNWFQIAPLYFACQQTLLTAGIPWRVITELEDMDGIQQLIVFDQRVQFEKIPPERSIINAHEFSSWKTFSPSFFERHPGMKNSLSCIADNLIRGYHASKSLRKLMDWLGMAKLVTHTPFFTLPALEFQHELLSKIDMQNIIRVISDYPVLIDLWNNESDGLHIHMVNYHAQKQVIKLKIPDNSIITVISPEQQTQEMHKTSGSAVLELDLYSICLLENK